MITDLRLAWRMFVRGRETSLLTVAMLAVAMAGTLTLFTVLTALTTIWPELPRASSWAGSTPAIHGSAPNGMPFHWVRSANGLVRMVMGREMKLIGVAVGLAGAGTLAVTRFAFVELLRLSIKDPFFWLGILLALGVVSAMACYTAVRGISRLEPMDALRDL